MLNRLKGIFLFDQLIWDATLGPTPFGDFWTVDVHLKVGDGYAARAQSRRKMHALAFALRDIAEQILAER